MTNYVRVPLPNGISLWFTVPEYVDLFCPDVARTDLEGSPHEPPQHSGSVRGTAGHPGGSAPSRNPAAPPR